MSSGEIEKSNFPGFRLFYVNGKIEYQNCKDAQIDRNIKENNALYERIDRGNRFGNLESELKNVFEDDMILKIEKAYKEDAENWSSSFAYAEILAARERKQAKLDNPLKIEDDDIIVYGELPFNVIPANEGFIIRNDGVQAAKKRNKNILIFNPKHYSSIHIQVACNTKIAKSGIFSDDAICTKDGKNILFRFKRKGITFHKIEINDETNKVKYVFKICMIDIAAEYMDSTVKHSFTIAYKNKKENSRIKLAGVGTDLIFNKNAAQVISYKLEDNEIYSCKYEEKLHIHTSEEELSDYGSGIKIDINFAGILVPLILYPDEVKSVEITGRKILKEKLAAKRSFVFDNGAVLSESQEYFVKANLLRELKIEQAFIDKQVLAGEIKNFYISDKADMEQYELKLPNGLKESYLELLAAFKQIRTIPTLAYLGGDLLKSVKKYLQEFENCFAGLQDGENLSSEQEDVLCLGTISVGREADEILLTPFHPINLAYQLALLEEHGLEDATDIVMGRLNSINLLPYIQRAKKIYKVSNQLYSQEWKYYAPAKNKKYRGNRRYIPKLVEEKISEFISHFRYIFDDIYNRTIRINLINMGDCSEVFIGLAQFFIHAVNRDADVDRLFKLELHIYTENIIGNVFYTIRDYTSLKKYLAEQKLFVVNGTAMSNLEGILSKNLECYFHKDDGKSYTYAHISFYEMESEVTSEQATMDQIETGISLGGILSGIPSSKYGQRYRTGYGIKYAEHTPLVKLASMYNALMQVEATGNPYHSGTSISTQIDELVEYKMDYIYKCSNWVVFVEPKVDLDFFSEKEADSDLLIIHYSDQYTSSSGYDAITVTNKSKQYTMVIQEYLKTKGADANMEDIKRIINLFNAVNGDWLLRLISSKKHNKDSTFSREKISMVAAIKFMLAFLKHEDIVWVPVSLEEMLRVSGGVGLSKGDGILSAKNLGFEKGPTSDDLLFIGLDKSGEVPKIYLYPTEVKTGINDVGVVKKAFEQVSATATGFHNAFNPEEERKDTILYKVNRNFLMQIFVTSCKKMQVYHVDDSQNWDEILEHYREAILNEKYVISEDIQELLGKGAVLSFRKGIVDRKASFKEDAVYFIEMPEQDEFGLILKDVSDIYKDIHSRRDRELLILDECTVFGSVRSKEAEPVDDEVRMERDIPAAENTDSGFVAKEAEPDGERACIQVLFGSNDQDGTPVIWNPNDTTQLFHTNTGIIGTMGTGKTQFTKSLITQLYRNQVRNVEEKPLGILIFDYKGDYNESKADFIQATNATVYKPYHLPFNPLALTKSTVFKPLLPTHTANAFKDTISKVYHLGPKQQAILLQCIMDTYALAGINPGDPATWEREAPTFDQVYQRYANDDAIKKGDSLAAALDKLHMFQIFESNPNETKLLFDILKGVVVIDLLGYDPDIQSLIIAITLDLFYSQMQASGSSKMEGNFRQLTKMILVDEADNFMSEGFPSLKKILKEGREFGVGVILSTQFLKHFGSGEDDYSKYILTWAVHNVSDLKYSDVEFVFKTESKSQENQVLFHAIKNLEKHHSIIKIGNLKPVYVKDKAFWEFYKEMH